MPKRCRECDSHLNPFKSENANICIPCMVEHAEHIESHKIVCLSWDYMNPYLSPTNNYDNRYDECKKRPGIVIRETKEDSSHGIVFKVLFGIQIISFNSCHLKEF